MTTRLELPSRELGRSRVRVSRLGLGASGLGGMFRHVEDSEAQALVAAALDGGITYVDVAPLYGHGTAERRLGEALRGRDRDSFVVSTKVGRLIHPRPGASTGIFVDAPPSDAVFDYSRDGILRSLEQSLQRLGLDRVDVVYIHDPDDHEREALDAAYPALHDLRSQGVVRAIGVGMNQSAMPTRFVAETDIDVVLLAGRYTLLDRTAVADLLPAAVDREVGVVNAGVYNSGLLADPRPGARFDYAAALPATVERAQAIAAVCRRYDVPVGAAALQYSLAHPAVAAVLVGCRSAEQVRGNLASFTLAVPDALWDDLATELGVRRP